MQIKVRIRYLNSQSPGQIGHLSVQYVETHMFLRPFCPNTIELQWLEQAWDHEKWFQSKVVPASVSFNI